MYLSKLIENYLYAEEHFNKRKNYLYLSGWAKAMLDAGYICPSLLAFQNEPDVNCAENLFRDIISELHFLEACHVSEINEEFLYQISVREYQQGCFDSASEFLYYKKQFAEKIQFPYQIIYSGDSYISQEVPDSDVLEAFAAHFIETVLLLHEFQEWTENQHWHVRKTVEKQSLPEYITQRYCIPSDWMLFIRFFECCSSPDDTAWFLTCEDYQNQNAFCWNEFELLELESARSNAELTEIMQFWNQYFPVMLSVKGEYTYYAVNTADGSIISGSEPEFRNIEIIADSFSDLIQKIMQKKIII